jgi:hypothetical protein
LDRRVDFRAVPSMASSSCLRWWSSAGRMVA